MKFRPYANVAIFLALLGPAAVQADLPAVTVHVTGFPTTTGTVEVSLFNSAESFLKEPFQQESGTIDENGDFETVFAAVPEGTYAVVVVHDANNNGKLDSGFLGLTGEVYGYSNNVHPWFGRPAYEDVLFAVDQSGARVEIDLE